MSELKVQSCNTVTMPWQDEYIPPLDKTIQVKMLVEDAETGMSARIVRYPAGFVNKRHTHNCAHGMYVLEGTLVTHEGSYGPGSFVWFPEGLMMEHGATPERDVITLFITNKAFDISYECGR